MLIPLPLLITINIKLITMGNVKLNLHADVTSRVQLEPRKDATGAYLFGGLVLGRLTDITIGSETYKTGEFAGKTIKTLNFEWQEFKLDPEDPDRFHVHRERIIGTVSKEKGSRGEQDVAKNINEMWYRIKHILESSEQLPTYRDIASIPEDVVDEYFNLPTDGEVDARIAAFEKFFEFISAFANGDGNEVPPMYLDANNEGQLVYIKLLPKYPDFNTYAVPTWVKSGFVEPTTLVEGMPLPARILTIRPNESLELVKKAPNAPAAGAGAGIPVPGAPAANPSAMDYLRKKHNIG